MALTTDRIRQVLAYISDDPDVIPVADLVASGLPTRDMEILAANHLGTEVPGGQAQGETSADRYRKTAFDPAHNPSLMEEEGVYTPDLLIWLAGKTHTALWFTGDDPRACITDAKNLLRGTAEGR